MNIVEHFERMSGLKVQPNESKIISTVDRDGVTAWGYGAVLRLCSWNRKANNCKLGCAYRSVQRRFSIENSIENRVLIRNVIMLPAVLFAAAILEMPPWT